MKNYRQNKMGGGMMRPMYEGGGKTLKPFELVSKPKTSNNNLKTSSKVLFGSPESGLITNWLPGSADLLNINSFNGPPK